MNILVTGGAGFIGSNLVASLVEAGHKVTVIDDLPSGFEENLKSVMDKITFINASILKSSVLQSTFRDIEAAYHLAAIASVQKSIDNPKECHEVNVIGTISVLEAARINNVKKVILASSAAVYGDQPDLPKKETTPLAPMSPYAIDKISCENYMRIYHNLYGIETISFRFFNVFGENQDPDSEYAAVIPIFIKSMLKGKGPEVFGDGSQSRDFTYIKDLVDGLTFALDQKLDGSAINLATGTKTTLLELISTINSILGTTLKPEFQKARPGDIYESYSDISLARERFNFTPKHSLKEGLKNTVQFFKNNENSTASDQSLY